MTACFYFLMSFVLARHNVRVADLSKPLCIAWASALYRRTLMVRQGTGTRKTAGFGKWLPIVRERSRVFTSAELGVMLKREMPLKNKHDKVLDKMIFQIRF